MGPLFKSINKLFFGLTFLLLIVSVAVGQRLSQGSKPVTEKIPEYSEAVCSAVTGGFCVCRARKSEDGDADFVVLKGVATVNRIPTVAWKSIAVEPDGFFAYRGDLDKDGASEIVLVSLEGVSNGMGVTYSTAYIFDGRTIETGAAPISFDIQEFGERDNFIYDPRTRRTEILISYWAGYDSIEPGRPAGTYLMGKWFRYRNGKLEPVLEKPTLARRFLNSFAAERDNGWFENRKPHRWLSDPRTHKLFREPAETGTLVKVQTGTISGYTAPSGDNESPELDFATEDGQTVKGKVIGGGVGSDRTDQRADIAAIGIWKARYVYPIPFGGHISLETFFDVIKGRRIRLETYKTEYGREFMNVWLLD